MSADPSPSEIPPHHSVTHPPARTDRGLIKEDGQMTERKRLRFKEKRACVILDLHSS